MGELLVESDRAALAAVITAWLTLPAPVGECVLRLIEREGYVISKAPARPQQGRLRLEVVDA